MPEIEFLCLDCDETIHVEGKDVKELVQNARDKGWLIDYQEQEYLCFNCKNKKGGQFDG